MNHSEQMEALRRECGPCQRCALADTRTNLVFGDGNPDSGIMLIGEGPGEQEDLMGVPFVGRGGQLLDQMLDIIGLDRSKYYICNIVKCRPPRNRDPLNTEQEVCIGWLGTRNMGREERRLDDGDLSPRRIAPGRDEAPGNI